MTKEQLTRPSVTLKLATSLDGRIATASGDSKWITGPLSRERVHHMRAQHDCVLTGIGTVLADDPELTARTHPRPSCQPLRVVLDSKGLTPASSNLLATSDKGPICLLHDHKRQSESVGVHRLCVDQNADGSGLDLNQVLTALQVGFDVQSIMVEAGARLAGSFLRAGLVDKLVWFRAPIIIGGDGLSVFAPLGVSDLTQALALDCLDITRLGDDVVETYLIKQLV